MPNTVPPAGGAGGAAPSPGTTPDSSNDQRRRRGALSPFFRLSPDVDICRVRPGGQLARAKSVAGLSGSFNSWWYFSHRLSGRMTSNLPP